MPTQGQGKPDRFTPSYTDMLGEVRSSISGATLWSVEAITGTTFFVGALRNNSTDFFQLKIQCPHTRMLGSILGDIHVHYCLQAAPAGANETIIFTGKYCWILPGQAIPTSWTSLGTMTLTLSGTPAIRTYGIFNFATNITAPVNDIYGAMLLIEITRGNGTYTGNLAILDADAHSLMDRIGSYQLTAD